MMPVFPRLGLSSCWLLFAVLEHHSETTVSPAGLLDVRFNSCKDLVVNPVAPYNLVLRLRGGAGPHARLAPERDDIRVHYSVKGLPLPHHTCLRSALHPSRKHVWNGKRIYVQEAVPNNGVGDALGRRFERYPWNSTIRIGTMKYGSGKYSVARITGDDKVQLWGKWHFEGPSAGVFQGLYAMYMDYGPYKPLIIVSKGADVLFEQCEVRNFGGKCIVMQYFSEVMLDWCTVGGSCGARAPEHHKKLQVWCRPHLLSRVVARYLDRKARAPKEKQHEFRGIDLSKEWAPGGSRLASDGVSVESGSWLIAHRVCFEDTGRAGGMAVRAVGHARVNLDTCRFQRNRINLGADATAVLGLQDCHEFFIDPDREGKPGYRGDRTNFHAHRALQLPGNGTSVLEGQAPTTGPWIEWRIPNATNRNWQLQDRPLDPHRKQKRIEQRAERKAIKERLRRTRADGGAGVKVHARHRDFTPYTLPRTKRQLRTHRSDARRYERVRAAFLAPETLEGSLPVRRDDAAVVATGAAAAADGSSGLWFGEGWRGGDDEPASGRAGRARKAGRDGVADGRGGGRGRDAAAGGSGSKRRRAAESDADDSGPDAAWSET